MKCSSTVSQPEGLGYLLASPFCQHVRGRLWWVLQAHVITCLLGMGVQAAIRAVAARLVVSLHGVGWEEALPVCIEGREGKDKPDE